MILLIHLLLSSVSVECTIATLSCVYSEIMFTIISFFQKLIKGVGIRAGGWKIVRKLISGREDDYSVLESKRRENSKTASFRHFVNDAISLRLLTKYTISQAESEK